MTSPDSSPVLVLSLVHPDLLPSLYSVSEVLAARGIPVHLITFSSPARSSPELAGAMTVHECGTMSGGLTARRRARAQFRRTLDSWMATHRPRALVAACPFGYLEALRVRRPQTPVIFLYYEMYDASLAELRTAPATTVRNWRAMRHLSTATLICTPSAERAAWLLGRAGLSRLPATVLNSPSAASGRRPVDMAIVSRLLPEASRGKPIVIHTGGVTPSRCVDELVASAAHWHNDATLVVTNVADSPYARMVRETARASRRSRAIVLLPLLSRGEMVALQRAAHVGISLLRGEELDTMLPAPNKIAEYVHAALLVVTTRSSFTERLADRGLAVLSESLEPCALAKDIDRALDQCRDRDTRAHALRAAQEWYCMDVQLSPVLQALGYE